MCRCGVWIQWRRIEVRPFKSYPVSLQSTRRRAVVQSVDMNLAALLYPQCVTHQCAVSTSQLFSYRHGANLELS
jgi:hypothetical protein